MTDEQLEKIALIDKFFGAMSVEDLKEITETEVVVAKLKGTNQHPEIFKRLIYEHDMYAMELMTLRNDVVVLKSDFQTLLKSLNATIFNVPYNNDFQNLKNKHSIY